MTKIFNWIVQMSRFLWIFFVYNYKLKNEIPIVSTGGLCIWNTIVLVELPPREERRIRGSLDHAHPGHIDARVEQAPGGRGLRREQQQQRGRQRQQQQRHDQRRAMTCME